TGGRAAHLARPAHFAGTTATSGLEEPTVGPRTPIRSLMTAALWLLAAAPLFAQPPAAPGQPGEPPKSPKVLFRQAEDLIADGRYDVAAEVLKAFLAANPTDRDFLDITANR